MALVLNPNAPAVSIGGKMYKIALRPGQISSSVGPVQIVPEGFFNTGSVFAKHYTAPMMWYMNVSNMEVMEVGINTKQNFEAASVGQPPGTLYDCTYNLLAGWLEFAPVVLAAPVLSGGAVPTYHPPHPSQMKVVIIDGSSYSEVVMDPNTTMQISAMRLPGRATPFYATGGSGYCVRIGQDLVLRLTASEVADLDPLIMGPNKLYPTTALTVVNDSAGAKVFFQSQSSFYVHSIHFDDKEIVQPAKARASACDCGGHRTGYPDFGAGHSNWCAVAMKR